MKVEDLKQSSSYQKLSFDFGAFFMFAMIGLMMVIGGIFGNLAIILGGLIFLIFGGSYSVYFYKMMHQVKVHASSFIKTEGKVVNMEGYQSFSGVHLVVEFTDEMKETRRMPSTKTMRIFDISKYLEKPHTIYYSPKIAFVLIHLSEDIKVKQEEEIEEEDPYKIDFS